MTIVDTDVLIDFLNGRRRRASMRTWREEHCPRPPSRLASSGWRTAEKGPRPVELLLAQMAEIVRSTMPPRGRAGALYRELSRSGRSRRRILHRRDSPLVRRPARATGKYKRCRGCSSSPCKRHLRNANVQTRCPTVEKDTRMGVRRLRVTRATAAVSGSATLEDQLAVSQVSCPGPRGCVAGEGHGCDGDEPAEAHREHHRASRCRGKDATNAGRSGLDVPGRARGDEESPIPNHQDRGLSSARYRIRTCGLRLRRPTLYPAELIALAGAVCSAHTRGRQEGWAGRVGLAYHERLGRGSAGWARSAPGVRRWQPTGGCPRRRGTRFLTLGVAGCYECSRSGRSFQCAASEGRMAIRAIAVEDDEAVAKLIAQVLTSHGVEVCGTAATRRGRRGARAPGAARHRARRPRAAQDERRGRHRHHPPGAAQDRLHRAHRRRHPGARAGGHAGGRLGLHPEALPRRRPHQGGRGRPLRRGRAHQPAGGQGAPRRAARGPARPAGQGRPGALQARAGGARSSSSTATPTPTWRRRWASPRAPSRPT